MNYVCSRCSQNTQLLYPSHDGRQSKCDWAIKERHYSRSFRKSVSLTRDSISSSWYVRQDKVGWIHIVVTTFTLHICSHKVAECYVNIIYRLHTMWTKIPFAFNSTSHASRSHNINKLCILWASWIFWMINVYAVA